MTRDERVEAFRGFSLFLVACGLVVAAVAAAGWSPYSARRLRQDLDALQERVEVLEWRR